MSLVLVLCTVVSDCVPKYRVRSLVVLLRSAYDFLCCAHMLRAVV